MRARHDGGMDSAPRKPDRTLLIVVAIVAALVVVALIVVFTRGGGEQLDPATPQGVVQQYSQALMDGDEDAAREFLTSDLQADCERAETNTMDGVRLVLESTTERDDTAQVDVSIVYASDGGIFGPSEYRSEERFGLVREGTRWAIETTPWQFTICAEAAR